MVLNDSALPLRHSDLQCFVQIINHREEIKYNRSEWCSGRALAFKTIGRGSRLVNVLSFSDVGNAFTSWPRRMIYPYTFERDSSHKRFFQT